MRPSLVISTDPGLARLEAQHFDRQRIQELPSLTFGQELVLVSRQGFCIAGFLELLPVPELRGIQKPDGIIEGAFDVSAQAIAVSSAIAGAIVDLIWSLFVIRMALRKKYGEFRPGMVPHRS